VTRRVAALVVLSLPAWLSAWTAPELTCVCHSAPAPGSPVEVNADCSNLPAGPSLPTTAKLFYSLDQQASWTELNMSRLPLPGFDSTFAASFTAPAGGPVPYYVRSDNGTCLATQAPFNSGNTWPPGDNLVARAAFDSTGDVASPEGPWLDLTGAWVGWSGDRFYVALTNNHTGWPTSSGLFTWFAYSFGFSNPAARSDTWVFAPIFASVPLVMDPGLFAINRYTGAMPERIGNIDYQTSGNRLVMRCLISDLTADDRFGPWPSDDGWLAVAASTQTITTGGGSPRDSTNPARFYVRTPGFTVGQNRSPALSQPRVVPTSGTPETDFWFSVRYTDADSNLPVTRSLVVDSDTFLLSPNHHRYWVGSLFDTYRSGFAPGLHWFHFSFDDGMATVTSPADTFRVEGAGVEEAAPLSIDDCRFSIAPNPVAGGTATLRVQGVKGPRVQVQVCDAAGRLVRCLSVPNSSFPLDCSALSSGVYVVRLHYAGSTATAPLLILP